MFTEFFDGECGKTTLVSKTTVVFLGHADTDTFTQDVSDVEGKVCGTCATVWFNLLQDLFGKSGWKEALKCALADNIARSGKNGCDWDIDGKYAVDEIELCTPDEAACRKKKQVRDIEPDGVDLTVPPGTQDAGADDERVHCVVAEHPVGNDSPGEVAEATVCGEGSDAGECECPYPELKGLIKGFVSGSKTLYLKLRVTDKWRLRLKPDDKENKIVLTFAAEIDDSIDSKILDIASEYDKAMKFKEMEYREMMDRESSVQDVE